MDRETQDLIDRMYTCRISNPHTLRTAVFALQNFEPGDYRDQLVERCRAACLSGNWGPVTRLLHREVVA